ncbi:phospholipase D1 [[Candida] jaroonii]|uniref:Phospholipase D1 n=1 Tax=[Candida] jaroonii TaxID=467808 RepID=A0ACA9Y2R7_9ASCO|nr:phospholipase D1 [[Candida] jaroonii]
MLKTIGLTSSKDTNIRESENNEELSPTATSNNIQEVLSSSSKKEDEVDDNLRASEDLDDIYRTISRKSNGTNKKSKHRQPKSKIGSERSKEIGNSLSFFGKEDENESRYETDSDENRDRELYENLSNYDEDHDDTRIQDYDGDEKNGENSALDNDNKPNQTFSSFIPNMFRNYNNNEPGSNSQDMDKSKKRFQFFRKNKKDKDRKRHSVSAAPEEEEIDDVDKFTGERAHNLVGAMTIATPALSLIASCLLEDEHGISRAPLLLSLLGFRVTDISKSISTKNRKFRLDLEYGVVPQRLKWSVEKNARDLLYLHSRFKLDNWKKEVVRNKNSELPKYPIPPLRSQETSNKLLLRQRHKTTKPPTSPNLNVPVANGAATATVGSPLAGGDITTRSSIDEVLQNQDEVGHEDRASILSLRQWANLGARFSNSSASSSEDDGEQSAEYLKNKLLRNQEYITQVANYLNELIKLVALKPQSNRLFHFFEISPISSLLSYETGYTGKQGPIHIGGTAKGQGWRVGHFKANDLKGMIDRRSEKWLLIRGSYIMYVSEINSTLPLEVFLVDSKFKISYKGDASSKGGDDEDSDYDDYSMLEKNITEDDEGKRSHIVFKHLKITLENSERKISLLPKSEKEQQLWLKSLYEMKNSTVWSKKNRFDSFAPIRDNCYAQWFVDGRDYFWAISSAIEMAKDVVYIHDWWLSPQMYLRRPANGNQQWRIDRLLERKARQGVKIFIIIYRNVGSTVAIDSLFTKHSLLSLHDENIHVIRSPNQLLQNTYFWAHHEKLCIVDHTIAFIGGIDLCYGRYDTPDHVLVDDSKINFASLEANQVPKEEDFANFQIFPGKDYSNPRVKDFHELNKPYESMYDRNTTPRMPWHDVHMLTSGKVARDLSRHFVQRWNYLLRQKRPSRFTPLLTPPSDFTEEEEKNLQLGGTCEVQLLRSSGNWSLGLKQHEQSIQNAYLKLIETSEHFVYIENQFFVTSCEIDGNEIENRIGDALVDRIIRAHNEGTSWRAIIVIPLMPGFESQVDQPDGSSVRVIMQCQYMSISRGQTSIFAKLRKYGIDPSDYIQFYSLRKWGIIGPDRNLVTEQLYIHAKTMIVDDKSAIIGSANINERSMRGVRDSEMAALVRDRETVTTKMAGKDYVAGKFAHSLRIRLMREHLGVAVDIIDVVERRFRRFEEFAESPDGLKASTNNFKVHEHKVMSAMVEIASREILDQPEGTFRWKNFKKAMKSALKVDNVPIDDLNELEANDNVPVPISLPISFNNRTGTHEANRGIRDKKKHSYDARVQHSENHRKDVIGFGLDKYKSKLAKRARLNSGRFLKNLSQKVMEHQDTFIPDIDNVVEFLESDDFEMTDEMDEESEQIIFERNKERWNLLKKIAYLQRVTTRQNDSLEEENKKRAAAGMQANSLNNTSKPGSGGPNDNEVLNSIPEMVTSSKSETPNGKSVGNGKTVSNGKSGSANGQRVSSADAPSPDLNEDIVDSSAMDETINPGENSADFSEDVPIVSLNDQGVKNLMASIKSPLIDNFNNFVDPYCFEDPLDEDFYEDLWFEHARRNTEIFRMIFHTQPDDTVTSWREYKRFTKLQRAFYMAQDQETKRRKDKRLFNDGDSTSGSESEVEDTNNFVRDNNLNKRQSINVNQFNEDVGLLGYAPPSSENGNGKHITEEEEEDRSTISDTEIRNETPDKPDEPSRLNTKASQRKVGGNFAARRRAAAGDRIFDRQTSEKILNEIQGHLVVFPTDWLMRELEGGNWFYNTDRIPPIDIYD